MLAQRPMRGELAEEGAVSVLSGSGRLSCSIRHAYRAGRASGTWRLDRGRVCGGRRREDDDGSVDFSKPFEGIGQATELAARQARAMADAFVDKHVPQLARRKRFEEAKR